MPLVLGPEDRDRWLSASDDDARSVVSDTARHEERARELVVIPVSTWVNDVRNDDSRCLGPPEAAPTPAQTTLRFG